FDGPITLVCQGRSFFEVADINSALRALIGKVCPGHQYEELTAREINELKWSRVVSSLCARWLPLRSTTIPTSWPVLRKTAITCWRDCRNSWASKCGTI